MRIALTGLSALVAGSEGGLADTLANALEENGARVTRSGDGSAVDVVIAVSAGAQSGPVSDSMAGPEEANLFSGLARAGVGRGRRVIFVVSAASLAPIRGAALFSSRQAGLASLAQGLALELAPEALVNALAVGSIEDEAERLVTHTALKRSARPAEITTAALFLADPRNTYTTGHVMAVDGGWSVGYARNF
jgi:NAD(P)-dependent dehydrogenase (short-subunit alcohol dehydrogenase family)